MEHIDNSCQRAYFLSGATRDIAFRREQLRKLDAALNRYEQPLYDAFVQDMNKCREEALFTELMIVRDEIHTAIRCLPRWARDRKVCTNLLAMPSHDYIHYEPLGCALIIAPWNYPVNLLLCPLVGAIAAGCCATLKTSPFVPNVSRVVCEMIHSTFPSEYIAIYEGHREVNTALLDLRWDLIFFTGSPALGRTVMEAAAKNLTPCILELGGKSPCIVDKGADLPAAARRIAWGKLLNNGQTCIAPDYLLVHHSVSERFMQLYNAEKDRLAKDYPVVRKIRPHVENVWEQEIFGPEFPMRTFDDIQEAVDYVNAHEKPLAFYYFGPRAQGRDVLHRTSSGGAVINDMLLHIVNPRLPFGGVGNSGMGRYHHKASFLAFSNQRSVVEVRPFFNRLKLIRFLKEMPFSLHKK